MPLHCRYQPCTVLNILTLSTLYPNSVQPNFGGFVERQTARLAARPDVNLKVIAPVGQFAVPVGPYAALREIPLTDTRSGVEIHYPRFPLIPAIGWRLNPRLVERAVRDVLAALVADGFTPHVIDCEFFWPDGPAAIAIGKALGIPVLIKARGSDIRFWGQRPAARRMMVAAARQAGELLAVSDALRADMVELGMPGERITVHRTGIELDTFRPLDRAEAKAARGITGPLLLAVGNLVRLKRIHILIEAAGQIPGATLLVAGEGRERRRLQPLIEERGLADRVRLIGGVAHEDMPGLMAAADVFVHAAESEGLANVWVEALASGTPVVTTRVGGAAEVIDRPAAGRLVDDAKPDTFVRAINALLAAPPEPEAVRASALRFDWARNTDSLYRHLMALRR